MAATPAWDYKDIANFYERVRALLDNLSAESLQDKYIDMPEKAPYAEKYVKSKVKLWQSLDEEKFAMFESAIVYKTASLFESLVSSNSIKKKELPTIALEYFQRSKIQFDGMSLSDLADLIISEILEEEMDFVRFIVT